MSTGVVAIYTDKDGRVIASASDFDRSGYGGCSLEEAQGMRAKRALSRAVANAYCSQVFADALDWLDCENAVRKMGGKVTTIPVDTKEPQPAAKE